jgi:hypothetical protein
MITPVVRELKRVSPHGMRLVVPMAPARRPVTATRRPTTSAVHGDDGAEWGAATSPRASRPMRASASGSSTALL